MQHAILDQLERNMADIAGNQIVIAEINEKLDRHDSKIDRIWDFLHDMDANFMKLNKRVIVLESNA